MFSISQNVGMCVCLSHFLSPFNGLFAPTSRCPMSTLFIFVESSGKSNVKKWSQIWKLLLIKGVKSPQQKKLFLQTFLANLAFLAGFFWNRCYYPHWLRDSLSPVYRIFFSFHTLLCLALMVNILRLDHSVMAYQSKLKGNCYAMVDILEKNRASSNKIMVLKLFSYKYFCRRLFCTKKS